MKKLSCLTAVLLFVGASTAVTQSQLDSFKDNYNNQTDKVPSIVGNIVGGERLNVHIDRNGSKEVVGADMKGLKITNISKGGFEDETMNVYSDENTVETVLGSDAPFDQVKQELNENDITYNSTTTGGKMKITVFKSLSGLANFFGLSF